MNSKEAREYVHMAGYECKGTTRKALDIVLSDSEKLEKIEQIVNSRDGFFLYNNLPAFQQIKEVLENE